MRSDLALAAVLVAGLGAGVGCATKRPVLYPNAQLAATSPEVVQADVDRCMQFARQYAGRGSKAGEVAGQTAGSAAAGAAVGGAVGAVLGGDGVGAGRGAAAGAAGAGTRGLLRGLGASRQLDPIERSFTERCLRDLGYETAGWR